MELTKALAAIDAIHAADAAARDEIDALLTSGALDTDTYVKVCSALRSVRVAAISAVTA